MSKQHHFTVWYDTEAGTWEIGHANYPEDEPLYDTNDEKWSILRGEDATRDNQLLEDLRMKLGA